jgi:2-succinyl-5-enolpyruvyl-6-hydroxy-3-cyclohexene-1-carboxylate synthase
VREEAWRVYAGFTFVLPAVELIRVGAAYWLCANAVDGRVRALVEVLAGLQGCGGAATPAAGTDVARPVSVQNLTSFAEWDASMREILRTLHDGGYDKIVLARRKRFTFAADAPPRVLGVVAALEAPPVAAARAEPAEPAAEAGNGASSHGLDVETPTARGSYLFCLQLEEGCAFVGCTPERLFRVEGSRLLTQALAGTVRRGDAGEDGSAVAELCSVKNMEEHRFVVDYIQERLADAGLAVATSGPRVIRLPRLMHLATNITGTFEEGCGGERGVEGLTHRLLETMHPTPAVCGMPREETRAKLPALEKFDRGFFAGPLGWFSAGASDFCVAIRSALVSGHVVTAYAGSGIVKGSESRSEWDETELKMSAFTDMFGAAATPAAGETPPRANGAAELSNGHHGPRPPDSSPSPPSTSSSLSAADVAPTVLRAVFDPRDVAEEPNLNAVWGNLAVEELCRCGVDTFFVCPGSRSAPLAVAVARSRRARLTVVHDERGAGFMAVGYARATRRAAAVVTSSGTAVANLLPAVVEAANDKLPLLLLTADRPPELRDTGANQGIDQVKIFASHARWFKDVPCPSREIPVRHLLSDVAHAVFMSGAECGGPVHLNFMFRENLAPDEQPWDRSCLHGLPRRWTHGTEPYTAYAQHVSGAGLVAPHFARELGRILSTCHRVLVLVGGGVGGGQGLDDRLAIVQLAEERGWPVMADIASGMRLERQSDVLIPYGDLVFASKAVLAEAKVDAVVQFGERFTSKRLIGALASAAGGGEVRAHVVVTPSLSRIDPSCTASHRLVCTPAGFASQVLRRNPAAGFGRSAGSGGASGGVGKSQHGVSLLRLLCSASAAADSVASDRMERFQGDTLPEPWVARVISRALTAGAALFIGNSMPIRDFDSYAACRPQRSDWQQQVLVGANRGASGIDGVLSSGIGYAIGSGRSTVVVLGDMSFLHDLNALHALRSRSDGGARCPPVTVVVVNNSGGGIFSMLPIARHPAVFSPVFDTPHGVSFAGVADAFGLSYHRVRTSTALRDIISAPVARHVLAEVVVSGDHAAGVDFRRQLVAAVAEHVDAVVCASRGRVP